MTVGLTEMSLTRNTPLSSLTTAAAQLTAGMTLQQVAEVADQNGTESATSWLRALFVFDAAGKLVEDTFVRTAKAGSQEDAEFLAWAAIVWSEPRVARIVEQVLTGGDGRFDQAHFSTDLVAEELTTDGGSTARKAASSLLNRMSSAHLFQPRHHGSTIVGVERFLPSSKFAPVLVTFIKERLRDQVSQVVAERGDPVELALLWKANRWLGLTQDEFKRASRPQAQGGAAARKELPATLSLLDGELRRRRQVILQGAPGVGKTHVALAYVDWATADRRDDSNFSAILDSLPEAERTPEAVAGAVIARGLTAVWDLTQFHPSYGYEDFVRTLAPYPTAGGVSFRAEHRTLSFLAAVGRELASADSRCDVLLVVDEINRADIARTFGELLYALEYRGTSVRTPYAVDGDASMMIPANLLMIGTMNTADRAIALIDYALRRRFTFIDLPPDRGVVDAGKWVGDADRNGALALFDRVQTLFTEESAALAVGHSYFLPARSTTNMAESLADVARRFAYEVVPLLGEYTAEGLVDAGSLTALLADVGVQLPSGQVETQQQVLQWLKSA
jgi:5-methylcytosine-specific restriction protein B